MASGHVNRTNRPNRWLLRPALQDEPETLTAWSRSLIAAEKASANLFLALHFFAPEVISLV